MDELQSREAIRRETTVLTARPLPGNGPDVAEANLPHAQSAHNGDDARAEAAAEIQRLRALLRLRERQLESLTDELETVQQLRERNEYLEGRLAVLAPHDRGPKLPLKRRIGKWLAGREFYSPLFGSRPLPMISIVTPVKNGERWIRQTIESVLAQDYPGWEYIIIDGGSTDRTLDIVDEYRDRIDVVLCEEDRGMYDAIARGFEVARGEIFGWINADDLFEPGGLLRVGEYFRKHRRAKVIYHEDTVDMNGWRFPNRAQPRVDVYKLLAGHTLYQDGIFFRKKAYRMVKGVNRNLKLSGDWDLWVRMARMFGLRRAPGHVSTFRIRPGQLSANRPAYEAERRWARARFLKRFGLAGRIRCRLIRAVNIARDALDRLLAPRKMFWPIDFCGKPYPPGETPPLAPGKPISPLTGRAPDRLLFSTRDTRFGDPRIHYVYYDSDAGMAMAYPPMTQSQLNELYERHYSQPLEQVVAPDPAYHSPYRNFRGGNIVARNLSRLPCPWWWFNKLTYEDAAADEMLRAARYLAAPDNQKIRFLDVGCFEADLLDQFKVRTQWQLYGLEANEKAVKAARAKGHCVWQAAAEDAPLIVPEAERFDLIFLGQTIEHLEDPLAALIRLRLLLAPGGAVVVSVPNLDSKQVELFGPTWAHWHMPYHRTLLSRRALRTMAKLAGMRVEQLRTRTHPYWTTMSVQQNRLGLGGVVPHSAYFPNMMSMHGVRLTGWCRLLWDWRGRGDYMFAVLREA